MPAFDAKDKSRFETFSRRSLLVSGGMTAVFAVLVGRLYQLQIVQGDEYLTAAEDNRINQRLLAPPRGRIFDRFGVALASNRRNYRALVVPEQAPNGMAAALDSLAKVIPISDHQRARHAGRRRQQAVRAGHHRRESDVGRFRAAQSRASLSAGRAARRRRDARLSVRPRAVACAGLRRAGVAAGQVCGRGRRSLDGPSRGFASASAASRRPTTSKCAGPPAHRASRSMPMAASSASSRASRASPARKSTSPSTASCSVLPTS